MFDHAVYTRNIVHVDCHVAFIDEVFKMSLIIVWKVAGLLVRPKNMTRAQRGPDLLESGLPLTPFLDSYVVVSPTTSNLVKYFALESEIALMISGTRGSVVCVLHLLLCELSVVLDKPQFSIFLFLQRRWRRHRRLGRANPDHSIDSPRGSH